MQSRELIQIAKAPEFQERVQYALVAQALIALNSSPTNEDARLAQKVLDEKEPLYPWSLAVVSDGAIAPGTYPLDGRSITDAQIQTAVAAHWAAFLA